MAKPLRRVRKPDQQRRVVTPPDNTNLDTDSDLAAPAVAVPFVAIGSGDITVTINRRLRLADTGYLFARPSKSAEGRDREI